MLFLAWLAVSFVVVVAVNLYLRYFGLPRRPLTGTSTTTTADGRVLTSTGVVSYGPGSGGAPGSTGFTSGFQGFFGGLTGGTAGTGTMVSGVQGGETGRWVNAVLSWIYNRTPSGSARPEVLDAWMKALSDEADQQSRDMRIRFDDIRGSIPEFSNFSVGPSTVAVGGGQTAAMTGGLTVYTTVTAKDITLQMCMLTQTAVSSRTIYSDVYLLHLHGQLKVVITPNLNTSEIPVHISFVNAPEVRLQILPSGRLDNSVDIASVEKAVRGALGNATTKLSWSSAGGFRSAYVPTQMQQGQQQQLQQAGLRTENHMDVYKQQVNQLNAYGAISPQQGFSVNQTATGYSSPSTSGLQQFQQPAGTLQQQQQQQLLTMQQQQQQQQYMQPHQQQQMQFSTSTSGDMMRPFDMNNQNTQFTAGNVAAHRLLIKVIKANGLGSNDSSSCNAYCVIRVDRPPQNYMTSVARNTVNPLWDESFVVDIDMNTRQLQLDVLDRDKPPDTELLGKTIIQMDEIRRMPASSRQILPLTGRPRSRTTTSGSVTVEFAIMDAADLSRLPVVDNVNAIHTTQLHQSPQAMTGAAMHPMNTSTMQPASLQFNADATGGQYGGGYQNRLSAHDMALSQQPGLRPQDSPSLIVTGSDLHRTNPQYQNTGTLDARGRGQEKKESFASALKKRLSRGAGKKRSQSADRTQLHTQSLHDPYLRPPGDNMAAVRGTDTNAMLDASGERKVRSNSFSSSLRRIFKPSSSSASEGAKSNISREGSLTRSGNMPATSSGLGDLHFQQQQQQQQQQYQLQQQQMGYGSASAGFDRSMRQNTPVPPEHRGTVDVQFSGSMSTTPPAQHHSMGLSASVGGRY